ncbi:unnamed protein product [Cylicostephanus goldi]|uniref:Uncharacterized protein n=1 Tax=Cylicostephanus goldi TaxID=71465 RepID=A0A3P6RGJ3_CYLGO|nr:unnamed protein product [Cylicostephanus goldi]
MSGGDSHIEAAVASSAGKSVPIDYAEEHENNPNFYHISPLEGSTVTRNHDVNEERSGLESAIAGHKADDIMSDDTSYVITELSPIAPLKITTPDTIEDDTASNTVSRPSESRDYLYNANLAVHDAGNKEEMSMKVNTPARKGRWKNHQPSPFVRSFECHYPVCYSYTEFVEDWIWQESLGHSCKNSLGKEDEEVQALRLLGYTLGRGTIY